MHYGNVLVYNMKEDFILNHAQGRLANTKKAFC